MAEQPAQSLTSPSKKGQNTVREEERFDCIKHALPPHLLPGEVPEPLTNLSTKENERLALFYQLVEDRLPSDGLANMYFADEIKKVLKGENAECFGHQFIRLSRDGRYGYIAGERVSTKQRPARDPSTFLLFTLSQTGDGRILHGRYMWVDVQLAPLTPNDHQYRGIPATTRGRYSHENISCTAIAFHSFDENLRRTVQEAASSSLNDPSSSIQIPSLPPALEDRTPSRSLTEDPPVLDIEGPVVDDETNGPMTAKISAGQADDISNNYQVLDHNGTVALRRGPEDHHYPGQVRTEGTAEEAEDLRHSQVLDPVDHSGDERFGMNSSVPASSTSSTTAKPSTSTSVLGQEPSKDTSTIPRSRKGKERAQDPEEADGRLANIATDLIETKLRIKSDSSYASQIAANEAKQNGISQEQLESMVKIHEPSNAVDEIGDESAVGSFANHQGDQTNGDSSNASNSKVRTQSRPPDVENLQQASSSALVQYPLQFPPPLANNSRRRPDGAQPSSPSREVSPTRTEEGSHLSYDGEAQDDWQDMGETGVVQDPENSGPTTPGPVSAGDKRKRGTPSTGSSERPPTKHQRPGFELEDPCTPLPRSRFGSYQHETISRLTQPAGRGNTRPSLGDGSRLGAIATINGKTLPALVSPSSIPEEEISEVAGGSRTSGAATLKSSVKFASNTASNAVDRAGDTEDDRRETESQFYENPTTSHRIPFRGAPMPSRVLAKRLQNTQDSAELPPTSLPSALRATTTPTNGIQASPSTADSLPQAYVSAVATRNRSVRTQHEVDETPQTHRTATSERHKIDSPRPQIAVDHTTEFLGLLRGWRAAFINLDDGLLAQAGLQVTRAGTTTEQTRGGIGVEQPAQGAPNPQAGGNDHYYSLLLNFLETSRGVLSTVPPEVLSTVGLEIISRRPRTATLADSLPLHNGFSLSSQEEQGPTRTSTPLSSTISNQSNLEYLLSLLKDSLNSWSLAAPARASTTEPGLNGVISSVGMSQVNQVSGSRGGDRRTKNVAVETEGCGLPTNQSEVQSSNRSSTPALTVPITDRHEALSSGLDTAKPKTKQKSKNRKNKEKPDPDAPNAGPAGTEASDGLGDTEMAVLDAQAHSHLSASSVKNPPPSIPPVTVPTEAVHTTPPSPMDTEWDDMKFNPKDKEVESQDVASPSNEDSKAPSGSSASNKEGHREGSRKGRQTQSTAIPAQQEGQIKQLPKKKGSGMRGMKGTLDTVRPGGPFPEVEDRPGPSRTGPSVDGPVVMPSQKTPSPVRKASTTPSATLALDSRDEIMVDIESPKHLPERYMNYGSQIPVPQNFGEAPIVPDDEGPRPFTTNLDVSATGINDIILNSNTPPTNAGISTKPTEQQIPGSGRPVQSGLSIPPNPPAESAVVDQVIPETPARSDELGPGGSIGLNINSSHDNEEQGGEGGTLSGADAPVHDLADAFGLWSFFYEASSSPSQTNDPEES